MAEQYLSTTDYADFRTGHETAITGGRIWWHNIIAADRDRIFAELAVHAAVYRRQGYHVRVEQDADNAELHLGFRRPNQVTTADIEILKGSMAATEIKLGWGGGR